MRRPFELSLSQLESREVPAASLFAEIRPGEWGSNPVTHGVSGDTLYFSANNIYQGTELWATDGTKTGTRMVADLNPGKPGSGIFGVPAGGGVMYFTQQNEGSSVQKDYKTDGTAAGTVPIAHGIKSIGAAGVGTFGWKGELYAYTRTATPGVWALSKTDGTTMTVLTTFNGQPLDTGYNLNGNPWFPAGPSLYDGGTDKLQFTVRLKSGGVQVWQTDGTVAGTVIQQSNLKATSSATGEVELFPGHAIGGGQYLFQSVPKDEDTISSLWVGDGTGSRTLLRTFAGQTPSYVRWGEQSAAVSGKLVFTVGPAWPRSTTTDTGVWVSDGTAAGTTRLNLPNVSDMYPVVRGAFDGKAVVRVPTADPTKGNYVLTDGTTTPLPTPVGTEGEKWELRGTAPADAAHPKGLLLFQVEANGKAYRTDGTVAGTAVLDTDGLPRNQLSGPQFHWFDWNESVHFATLDSSRGFYFKGDVYFPGRVATADPKYGRELWKWDLDATPPPTNPAPKVTGTVVNDGSAQRSMVKTLTVSFDSAVNVTPSGVTITDTAGRSVAFSQQTSTANGVTTLTITFPNGVGGSIADGRYTLKIAAGAVTRVSGGTAMATDYTFGFTRLYGDTSGDGVYDRETRMLVKALLGQTEGDPGYRWDLDVNSDGKIDATDELAAIRGWGKAV